MNHNLSKTLWVALLLRRTKLHHSSVRSTVSLLFHGGVVHPKLRARVRSISPHLLLRRRSFLLPSPPPPPPSFSPLPLPPLPPCSLPPLPSRALSPLSSLLSLPLSLDPPPAAASLPLSLSLSPPLPPPDFRSDLSDLPLDLVSVVGGASTSSTRDSSMYVKYVCTKRTEYLLCKRVNIDT